MLLWPGGLGGCTWPYSAAGVGEVLEGCWDPLGTQSWRQGLWDQLQQATRSGHSLDRSNSHPGTEGLWRCGERLRRASQGFGVVL